MSISTFVPIHFHLLTSTPKQQVCPPREREPLREEGQVIKTEQKRRQGGGDTEKSEKKGRLAAVVAGPSPVLYIRRNLEESVGERIRTHKDTRLEVKDHVKRG